MTTRTGSRPPAIRQVRRGLSAATVPAPTITASASLRQRWTSARDAGELIHCESPEAAAIRPSSESASFSVTNGRPRVTRVMKPRFRRRHSSSSTPTYDLDSRGAQNCDAAPAHRRIRIDASDHHPPHSRLHQRARTWRRASLMRAWLERHVSRRAARLRTRAGERHGLGMWTAAGGGRSLADDLPPRWPPRTITHPTAGLGEVRPSIRRASASALRMKRESTEEAGAAGTAAYEAGSPLREACSPFLSRAGAGGAAGAPVSLRSRIRSSSSCMNSSMSLNDR